MIGRVSSTDPGIVRLRDTSGNVITSSDNTNAGYQIDGMSIVSAEALTKLKELLKSPLATRSCPMATVKLRT